MISPQFGHGNFVVSVPGAIILWHDVHTGTVTVIVGFSLMMGFLCEAFNGNVCLAYMCYVLFLNENKFFVCVCA